MGKTAFEAGWRVSRYNLFAPIPGTKNVAIANLFKGTCGVYSPLDLFLLGELETLDAEHPILGREQDRRPARCKPEQYVLALYDRIGEEKNADEQSTVTG